ncbi:APC family permease [Mangrovihabitans endophyticus]|uniref:Amino acid permease n=1 Tax=Mangrovihabitans endophyticus TaxID=1751298 RepID=A0A8J3C063_9ACTN|nr:APC family permease [Mangrovihabitans endophyticus]GGK89842.1 amino acid permease [Mangrovihabitans endophyticus]
MRPPTPPGVSAHRATRSLHDSLRAGRLGTTAMFALGIAAVTPLSVVAGAIPLAYGQVRELGVPAGYAITAALLAIFTVGLAAMARHVPNAGAFYAYVTAGLGRAAGVATAGLALVAYNCMQIGLYGAFGIAATAAASAFGWRSHWGVWIAAGWLAVAVLGQSRTRFNARILAVLISAEVLVVIVLDAVMVGHPADGIRLDTLNPLLLAGPTGAASLVGAITGLVGFEIPLAHAALARDPRRTTRRAITLILAVVAVLYAGSAWAMSVATGPDRIIAVAERHLTDLFFVLPAPYVPRAVMGVAGVLFATSLFAAMIAFHSTVARYTLTLAREGVLPRWLAVTRADEVPVAGSAMQSTAAAVTLLAVVGLGLDPTIDLFFYGTISGGLGVLVLMSVTAVAVIRYFRRHPGDENVWRRRVAPLIAAMFLLLVLAATLAFYGELLGTDDPLKIWLAPCVYLLAATCGVAWARVLRRRRPEAYAAIGQGDRPVRGPGPGRDVPLPRADTDRRRLVND